MGIIEPVIRPPSEAYSFLLQVTLGCSANHCSFCGAYFNKTFCIKDFKENCAGYTVSGRKGPGNKTGLSHGW